VSRIVEKEMDKILDQYLEGLITAEDVRRLHKDLKANNGQLPLLDDDHLTDIKLPNDLLQTHAPLQQEEVDTLTSITEVVPPKIKESIPKEAKQTLVSMVLFILLLLVPVTLLFVALNGDSLSVVKQNHIPYDIESVERDFTNAFLESIWEEAQQNYTAADYVTTRELLDDILLAQPSDEYIDHFFMGISLISQSQPYPREAIHHFHLAQKGEHNLQEPIMWYLSLAYLQNGNKQSAKKWLEELTKKTNAYNFDQAQQLLKTL